MTGQASGTTLTSSESPADGQTAPPEGGCMPDAETVRRFFVNHPLYRRLMNGALRARQLGNPVDEFSRGELLRHWRANHVNPTVCAYCRVPLFGGWHLDHMTPLSRGGAHSMSNVVPSCGLCNDSKGERTAEEFTNREAIAA